MITFRTLSAMTVGFVLLTAGCIGSADVVDDVDLSVDSVSMRVLDQGSGLNGLWPQNFHDNKAALHTAATIALTDGSGSHAVGQAILAQTDLVDGNAGARDTFKYAIKCMLPIGGYVEYTSKYKTGYIGDRYWGAGIIDPSWWETKPLWPAYSDSAPAPRDELFECMMAHLNGFGVSVPIAFQGSFVHLDENINIKEYPIFEALWMALEDGAKMYLHVFPGDWFDTWCPEKAEALLTKRVCADADRTTCGITVRTIEDRKAACKNDGTGNWKCGPKPVLMTRLNPNTMSGMYADCF